MVYKLVVAVVLTLFVTLEAFALAEDRNQPINIESNRAHRDEKAGLTTYEGNVLIKQGSILIKANKVIMSSEADKVNQIVCLGRPAQFQQKPSIKQDLLLAKANRIEFQLASETIILLGSASLEQSGGTIAGERIEYNIKDEIVNAKGGNSGNERIQMVIPAKQLTPSSEPADAKETEVSE